MNIKNYLKRLNYKGELDTTLKTLKALHEAHAFTIPFENIDVIAKKDISLKLKDILKKLIDENRGGYCYELNKAFCFLLKEIGFDVQMSFARVLYQNPTMENGVAPMSHQITIVTINKKRYLADVGFGGFGIIHPIDIDSKKTTKQYNLKYKIKKIKNEYYLFAKTGKKYSAIYKFDLRNYLEIDYKYGNFFASNAPESRFVNNFICTKPTKTGRITILNSEFKVFKDGKSKSKKIDAKKRKKLLKRVFGIKI